MAEDALVPHGSFDCDSAFCSKLDLAHSSRISFSRIRTALPAERLAHSSRPGLLSYRSSTDYESCPDATLVGWACMVLHQGREGTPLHRLSGGVCDFDPARYASEELLCFAHLSGSAVWRSNLPERWFTQRTWLRVGYPIAIIASGCLLAPLVMPILPVPQFLAYHRMWLGFTPVVFENEPERPLPQYFADEFGWEAMTQETARVFHDLPLQDQAHAAILRTTTGKLQRLTFLVLAVVCLHRSARLRRFGYGVRVRTMAGTSSY